MTDSINSHDNNKICENDRFETNSADSYTDSKAGKNDGSEIVVFEDDMGGQSNINGVIIDKEDMIDENEVEHTEK